MKSVFLINSKLLFRQYADVVNKILSILYYLKGTLDLEHIKVLGGLVFETPPFIFVHYDCFLFTVKYPE